MLNRLPTIPLPKWLHKLASPPHFYRMAGRVEPWMLWTGAAAILVGAFGGLLLAPPDYQQGDAYRIIYFHVPAAYLAMQLYALMAICSAIGLVWRMKLAYAIAAAVAPVGLAFTGLALATGMLWGKPMWGAYWSWGDARLTSVLVMFFLYLGYMLLRASLEDRATADRAAGILAVVGVVNLPIIKFSVEWWSSLHQGPTISRLEAPAITWDMLWPLLVMIFGAILFSLSVTLTRARAEVLLRERSARWVRDVVVRSA